VGATSSRNMNSEVFSYKMKTVNVGDKAPGESVGGTSRNIDQANNKS
jgi:hypothetical protein